MVPYALSLPHHPPHTRPHHSGVLGAVCNDIFPTDMEPSKFQFISLQTTGTFPINQWIISFKETETRGPQAQAAGSRLLHSLHRQRHGQWRVGNAEHPPALSVCAGGRRLERPSFCYLCASLIVVWKACRGWIDGTGQPVLACSGGGAD